MATYAVEGMTCQGCAAAVTSAIMTAAPGTRVTVNLGEKKVSVEGTASMDAIKAAVEDAGFEFKGAVG